MLAAGSGSLAWHLSSVARYELEPQGGAARASRKVGFCLFDSSGPADCDEANNETSDAREIPGVAAAGAEGSTLAATPLTLALAGTVVAPGVPARRSRGCIPGTSTRSCYVWAAASGPLVFRVVEEPRHGTVVMAPGPGPRAEATYTPNAGFEGEDSFSYTATDARGLTSRPAVARSG